MKKVKPLLGDAMLAVALAILGILGTARAETFTEPDRRLDAFGFALIGAAGLILVVRRRWPLATLVVATLCTAAYLIVGYTYGFILVSFLVAIYTVARYLPLVKALPFSLIAMVVMLMHIFTNSAALPGLLGLVPGSAWAVVPFSVGVAVRAARESADRARAEAVRQRVDGERLRVAQEVHDIVGHGLAAIKMQADVALHLHAKKPEQAHVALEAISRSSSAALDELRATLAAVRRTGMDSTRSPSSSLTQLEELRQRMREAGVHVRVETVGTARALPEVVDLTGYRIVQESLTNVLRHSGAADATVSLRYDRDAVVVQITNAVTRASSRSGGLGIPGMRERVLALGGEFSAGPAGAARFEVCASLPIGGHS